MDVIDLVEAFQVHNQVKLWFRFNVGVTAGVPDLYLTAEATEQDGTLGDRPTLASVSVRCSALNLRNWNAALTHAMYALDFQLALNELEKAEPKRA